MFGDYEIEKILFYCHKIPSFLNNLDIKKVLVSNKITVERKTIITLLVTCMIIIKLNHYI